jgi:2-C-methyl-D-erythritol 4-phosphate cytidylyltransferase
LSVWAVLAAAGKGERLGLDRPKAFAKLGERALIEHVLERLDASEWIEGIVVAAPPGWEEPCILAAEEVAATKVAETVTGGETRTESVRRALAEVPQEAAVIVVHDAARPLVSEDVVERVVSGLEDGWDAAVPALPVTDTVKRVEGEGVVETIERASLAAAQTPQAFVADALRRAVASGEDASDCAALVEAAGGRVRIVEGDPRLRKITDASDLALVESWLNQ